METESTSKVAQQTRFPISRKISSIAIWLWSISIFLPGLVYYGQKSVLFDSHNTLGLAIFLIGWVGILATYVAWYANMFWFVAISRLRQGTRSAITPAAIAALLSLDTFRVDCITGGGPCETVYGVGIGAIIWMAAIFLTMLAASVREIETGQDLLNRFESLDSVKKKFYTFLAIARNTDHAWSFYLSMVLLVGIAGSSIALGTYDRVVGNADEQDMLKMGVVFKRSAVCDQAPKPIRKIQVNGVLEVVTSMYSDVLSKDPAAYLQLGVPVVRSVTLRESVPQDWYLENPNDARTMKSRPVAGEPDARLETTDSSGWVHVKLIDKNGVIALELTQRHGCPNISGFSHYNTAKLVRQALILPADSVMKTNKQF